MGPLRRGLILWLLPTSARAEVSDKERPDWDGTPVTEFSEAVHTFSSAPMLMLLALSLFAAVTGNRPLSAPIALLWLAVAARLATADLNDVRWAAVQEGCIGHTTLSIGLCAAICVLTPLMAWIRHHHTKEH